MNRCRQGGARANRRGGGWRWLLCACLLAGSLGLHWRQYPERTITMIVPFPPGGVADTGGAAGGRRAGARAQAAGGDREQARRRRRARHGPGGARRARRLHGAAGVVVDLGAARGRRAVRPQARVHAEPVQADRALHGRPHGAGGARRRTVEDARRVHRRRQAQARRAATTAARATTARCTCRWRCSKSAAGFRMVHIPFTGAGPAVVALLGRPGRCDRQRPGHGGAAHPRRPPARAGSLG